MMAVNLGKDVSCTTEIRSGRLVSGARLVGEAIFRRLTTRRGSLRGGEAEQNYGLDLRDLVGTVRVKADEASLPGRIKSEISKDERILSSSVSILSTQDGPATTFTITVEAETGAGPFTLVIAASAVTVELIGLTVEG